MAQTDNSFDVIVVGGGHAGTEAALASARVGARTMLLTQSLDTIGRMSCNPAIGGIGKGHLVREIDALGGIMGHAADLAGIQVRTLNASKGPAVRATRSQCDRVLYRNAIQSAVHATENLHLFQSSVDDLMVEDNRVCGVITNHGQRFNAKAVVLTVGTFLGGVIHIGPQQRAGGRAGDAPSNALAERLRALPFRVGRLKTGTPPRLDARTVDLSVLQAQPGDQPLPTFSHRTLATDRPPQICCYIANTNPRTHDIIRDNLHASPMYSGTIDANGPRYCPSIEDKIVRFADKTSHQIFVEPEGLNSNKLYPNGISTSLPYAAQLELVRSIAGFEAAHITRHGYAIEYDFFDPRELRASLETRHVEGLYFAGQINGTTGYEEAAAQGLIAGLNAARVTANKAPWTPGRHEAYIGVLIDDLITRGAPEPYRMFTSRAEFRLMLREDNADLRLTPLAHELDLVSAQRAQQVAAKATAIAEVSKSLKQIWFTPQNETGQMARQRLGINISREVSAADLLKRPEVGLENLLRLPALGELEISHEVRQQVEIETRYAGYVARQMLEVEKLRKHDRLRIPEDFDFKVIGGLSNEAREVLERQRPQTVGIASRIPGITPAAVSQLLVYLKRDRSQRDAA